MAEPKWTPGPWRKMKGKYTDTYVIVAGDYADEGEPDMFAEIVTPNEMDADLIAAAPDLYEACEAAYRYLNRLSTHTREQAKVFALVRTALRKARGEDA